MTNNFTTGPHGEDGCPNGDWRVDKYPDGTAFYICENCGQVRHSRPRLQAAPQQQGENKR